MALSTLECEVLAFERVSPSRYPGTVDSLIGDRFGWSPTRYYQVLADILDRPEALAYDPQTVARLLRIRDRRRAARTRPQR